MVITAVVETYKLLTSWWREFLQLISAPPRLIPSFLNRAQTLYVEARIAPLIGFIIYKPTPFILPTFSSAIISNVESKTLDPLPVDVQH